MDNLTALKTSSALLDALYKAAYEKQAAEEIREQRISFIMGSIGFKNGISRSCIKDVLDASSL